MVFQLQNSHKKVRNENRKQNKISISNKIHPATDMIRDEVDKACGILVKNIITSPQVDSVIATEIDRKKNNLASDIKELLKESFDEIGSIITECFSIPSNVTLSTDQYKLRSIDVSEEELQKQHDELLKKFMMVCSMFCLHFFACQIQFCVVSFAKSIDSGTLKLLF